MGEPTKQLKTTLRGFTVVIVMTVLCGILATVASVVYTTWSNNQQDAKMCRLLHVVEDPSPPPPANDRERRGREAFEQYKRDIHCR